MALGEASGSPRSVPHIQPIHGSEVDSDVRSSCSTYLCSTVVRGTAVSCGATGRFRYPNVVDVVLGKAGHLQLLQIDVEKQDGGSCPTPTGAQVGSAGNSKGTLPVTVIAEQPVFGAVLELQTYPARGGRELDTILLLSDACKVCFLDFDLEVNRFVLSGWLDLAQAGHTPHVPGYLLEAAHSLAVDPASGSVAVCSSRDDVLLFLRGERPQGNAACPGQLPGSAADTSSSERGCSEAGLACGSDARAANPPAGAGAAAASDAAGGGTEGLPVGADVGPAGACHRDGEWYSHCKGVVYCPEPRRRPRQRGGGEVHHAMQVETSCYEAISAAFVVLDEPEGSESNCWWHEGGGLRSMLAVLYRSEMYGGVYEVDLVDVKAGMCTRQLLLGEDMVPQGLAPLPGGTGALMLFDANARVALLDLHGCFGIDPYFMPGPRVDGVHVWSGGNFTDACLTSPAAMIPLACLDQLSARLNSPAVAGSQDTAQPLQGMPQGHAPPGTPAIPARPDAAAVDAAAEAAADAAVSGRTVEEGVAAHGSPHPTPGPAGAGPWPEAPLGGSSRRAGNSVKCWSWFELPAQQAVYTLGMAKEPTARRLLLLLGCSDGRLHLLHVACPLNLAGDPRTSTSLKRASRRHGEATAIGLVAATGARAGGASGASGSAGRPAEHRPDMAWDAEDSTTRLRARAMTWAGCAVVHSLPAVMPDQATLAYIATRPNGELLLAASSGTLVSAALPKPLASGWMHRGLEMQELVQVGRTPLVDCTVADLEGAGQNQVLAVCGPPGRTTAQLLSPSELFATHLETGPDFEGLSGMWGIQATQHTPGLAGVGPGPQLVLLSFVGDTRLLQLVDGCLRDVGSCVPGLAGSSTTLATGLIGDKLVAQVTPQGVHLCPLDGLPGVGPAPGSPAHAETRGARGGPAGRGGGGADAVGLGQGEEHGGGGLGPGRAAKMERRMSQAELQELLMETSGAGSSGVHPHACTQATPAHQATYRRTPSCTSSGCVVPVACVRNGNVLSSQELDRLCACTHSWVRGSLCLAWNVHN